MCVNEPLFPYAKKVLGRKRWEATGPCATAIGEDIVFRFLSRLCKWQRGNAARDCQILSVLDISTPLLLIISLKNSPRKIRHLVLTASLRSSNENLFISMERIVLKDAIIMEPEQLLPAEAKYSIKQNLPRCELYPNTLSTEEKDTPVTYIVDVYLRPLEEIKLKPFGEILVNYILSDIDKVNITLGPVSYLLFHNYYFMTH